MGRSAINPIFAPDQYLNKSEVLNAQLLTCYDARMKKALANDVANKAKPAKRCARLAKVVAAKPSHSKSVRQAAFSKASSHMSVAKAVSRAKLIAEVDPGEFRIVRMPG